MEKARIITLKREGVSAREISRRTGISRDTIAKYWREFNDLNNKLKESPELKEEVQDEMLSKPKSATRTRRRHKFTPELEKRLHSILEEEKRKDRILGANHKQSLTNTQIRDKLVAEGFEISQPTINNALAEIRCRQKNVYIRQQYDFGDRLEYDFGEVRLDCGEGVKTYHMAVFCAPASKFRWLYLYTNQKKAVFMDSHVQFFEMMGGVWREIVYDNMKNVVAKFIGKNEKELNEDLVKMSMYYGFKINVTNCFSGNEKGSVEKSVDVLRSEIFADNWRFLSLDDARQYAESRLNKMNEECKIEEEKACLLPPMPLLELADICQCKVDKSSLISVDCVKYSVPEHLVGKLVMVKKYHEKICVYAENQLVCVHKRAFGNGTMQIDIMHYLNTLHKKPGAVKNSSALKSIPKLKAIFDKHYIKKPKQFIEILQENKHLTNEEIFEIFEKKTAIKGETHALDVVKAITQVDVLTRSFIDNYAALVSGGAKR
ncbi:MAG: IS21 family transposase [Bacilli bacterium]